MKPIRSLVVAALACVAAVPASAVPIRATFSGTVTEYNIFPNVLNDIPVGTAASFDVTFDDSGLGSTAPLTDFDLAPVSGTVTLGSRSYTLGAGIVDQYFFNGTTNAILGYGLQLTGSGPTLSGNASLYGLFLRRAPDLTPYFDIPPTVGFAYPVAGGEFYSYAVLGGTFTAARVTSVTSQVPEPSSALLLLPALLLVWSSRRTGRGAAARLAA